MVFTMIKEEKQHTYCISGYLQGSTCCSECFEPILETIPFFQREGKIYCQDCGFKQLPEKYQESILHLIPPASVKNVRRVMRSSLKTS